MIDKFIEKWINHIEESEHPIYSLMLICFTPFLMSVWAFIIMGFSLIIYSEIVHFIKSII